VLLSAGLAAALLMLGGCAQSGYDASRIRSELRRAGFTDEQARCVTDGFENEDEFNLRQLASYSDPTAKEQAKTNLLLARCGVSPRPR
jgi:hypothetical protein